MSESEPPFDTWSSLLAELKETALGDDQTSPCSSEEDFRANFENLCEEHGVLDAQRLLGRFRREHVAILTFTAAIDGAQGLQAPETLRNLFWQLAFATVHVSRA